MNCKDMETQAVCLRSADGTRVSAVAHYEYGTDASAVVLNASTRFTDASGEKVFDPADFDEITVGACPTDIEWVESQEWTYGIDNTGTLTNRDAILCITNSDGSTVEIVQSNTGAASQWTPQMGEWGTNLQAAADAAGLLWFVETRFRWPDDPEDLSGGGGFPGPPSVAVSKNLKKMLYRYLNIQICPGQPVPVAAVWKELDGPGGSVVREVNMTTDGAVLGPLQKFWICTECGRKPTWYLADGVTLATAGQIPNCWEPCGTLALAAAPPDRDCTFEIDVACDNNNSTNTANFTNTITRRATICNGEQIAVDYFQSDPNDPNALIDYTLVGAFVDCATGEPIPLPPQPCEDFVSLGNLWHLKLNGPPSTLVEWWADPNGPMAGTGVAHDNVSNIFTNDGTTLSHVSGPADNSYVAPTFSVEGSNASDFINGMGLAGSSDSSGTDQGKLSTYFFLKKDALLRDGGTRIGERGGIWLNECCAGDLELVSERTTDTTSADRGVFNGVVIPAGIHYGEGLISDLSAWWNFTAQASFDGGQTYGDLIGYADKPEMECIPVIKCKDSGLLLNALTADVLDPENLFCDNPCASPSSTSDTTTTTTGTLRIA